jgi:uncharacterized protein
MRNLFLAGFFVALGARGLAWGEKSLSIATGGTGGVWYPVGGAMANVFTKYLPHIEATAEVTSASVDNLRLLGAGKVDLAFTMADALWDAYTGQGKFINRKLSPLRTLAVIHPIKMHVVAIEGHGIETMAHLKGKRVSTGAPGSGTEVMALRVLEAYGIDAHKDIIRERLSVAEAVNAMKDRKLDAFIHGAAVPIPAVAELAATPGLKIRLIDHDDSADFMNKKYAPIYTRSVIPARSYSGQDFEVRNADVWALLITNDKMSDKLAYDIVRTLFEKKSELLAVHKEALHMSLQNQLTGASPIPFHRGALKYLAEQGLKVK